MKTDMYLLQNRLKTEGGCSLPQLMLWCGLDYPAASSLLRQLIRRGWVSGRAEGVRYGVQPENLRLRKLRRREAECLFPKMNRYEVALLVRISEECGVDRLPLDRAARSISRAEEALEELKKRRLIYCYDGKYFPCIGYAEAMLLQELTRVRVDILDEDEETDGEQWQQRAKVILDRFYTES